MLTVAMRTVFVGTPTPQITTILTRLGQKGFGSYAIESLRQCRFLIEDCLFELVISLEQLDDGQGYELIEAVKRSGGSLFVGVETSRDCLWLPVVDHGHKVHGASALDYGMLEGALEDVLTHRSMWGRPVTRSIPEVAPQVERNERSTRGEVSGRRIEPRWEESWSTHVSLFLVRPLLRTEAYDGREGRGVQVKKAK